MAKELKIELRQLQHNDYEDVKECMIKAYQGGLKHQYWSKESIDELINLFPDGQLGVEVNGKIAAVALAIIVDYKKFGDNHTYEQITGNYTFSTHDLNGDVLYGIDVFVHPEYRNMRLGRRLYDARKETCENLNLRAIIAGGRIPHYSKFEGEFTPKVYMQKVKMKEIYDPVLSFQISNDFHVKKILKNYLPGDTESRDYAILIEWNNIYFQKEEEILGSPRKSVRIGLVQWQMRFFPNYESLITQVEYFVDSIAGYNADFILFPEFFDAPLMADFNHLDESVAIRKLADFTDQIREKFVEFAISYNVNIISGSMPYLENGNLRNISFLCRRDGTWDSFSKVHPTPSEVQAWGMTGGSEVRVFDTDCGKVGILVCYDVEFPELSRILADQGMQILFVPFMTDTQNGYNRVRFCAQARAIENECYVAIAGSVGNLPRISNMDIQYGQSAIFTPSDFAFSNNAMKAEATPNTEMMVIGDVDLELLKELHEFGSVRNLKDRRKDLYDITYKK